MCQNLPQKLQEQKYISEWCQSSEEQPIFIPPQSMQITWEKCSSVWRPKTHSGQRVLATTVAQCGQNRSVWPTCDQSFNPAVQAQLREFYRSVHWPLELYRLCPGSHMEWTDPCGKASDCKPWKRSLNTFRALAVENAKLGQLVPNCATTNWAHNEEQASK